MPAGRSSNKNLKNNSKFLLTKLSRSDNLNELLLRNTKQQQRPARQELIDRCDENSQSNSDNQIEMQP